ncbi:chaperone modulator CbpM [Simplicispira suum]|uniref:MerR family transcriptional regulator n=1 Tax=Simplicispira suum TaxID=2109915 RepID=A0A2S0N159_9BURK|nr:chaperone modulator CbpM [Simplicispira suum]AVO41691.1 MerR family transcriptional regulator [Simplicispira suum]
MPHAFHLPAQMAELLGDDSLTLEELARACRRAPEWVSEHVEAGVIAPQPTDAASAGLVTWRFASTTLVRARRMADLEASFDADPYLAALTVDLMEEVGELRRQLRQLQPPAPGA